MSPSPENLSPGHTSPETRRPSITASSRGLMLLAQRTLQPEATREDFAHTVITLDLGIPNGTLAVELLDGIDTLEQQPDTLTAINAAMLERDKLYKIMLDDINDEEFEATTQSGPETKAALRQLVALWRLRYHQSSGHYGEEESVALLSIKQIYGRLVYDASPLKTAEQSQRDRH